MGMMIRSRQTDTLDLRPDALEAMIASEISNSKLNLKKSPTANI